MSAVGAKSPVRERIVDVREVRASDLIPNQKNWRLHPTGQRRALEQVLEQVGNVDVLRAFELPDGRLQLFDGHLRRDIRGDDLVKVAICDLTEEEADLVLATFDPIAAMAETSRDKLAELSARAEGLRAEAPDLLAMLDGLLVKEEEEGGAGGTGDGDAPEPKTDRAAELAEEWGTALGQVWEIPSLTVPGRCHRVMCGNSLDHSVIDAVLDGQVPDGVWSDAPYGIAIVSVSSKGGDKPVDRRRGTVGGGKLVRAGIYAPVAGDENKNTARESFATLYEMFPKALHVWWGANHFSEAFPASSCWIVWDKQNTGNFADAELAWCSDKGAVRIFAHMWNGLMKASERGESRIHPTQKPVALFEWCAGKYLLGSGKVWFDPFAGSGISVVGAERMAQICCAVELSPGYVAATLQRLKDMGLEPRLATQAPAQPRF